MPLPPVYLRHGSSLDHDTGAHPEGAGRIPAIERALEQRGWLGYEVRDAPEVDAATLEAVHPAAYVRRIASICAAGGGMLDADTTLSPGSYTAAVHAAGGAVALVDALLTRDAPTGFAALRPPGHHAEPARGMGFCLFNSIAVAARHAVRAHGLRRVLIVDWDVHHGNGTQAVFEDDPTVLVCSIHQRPLYPGTGAATERGRGAGAGYTVNLPVPPGSGDDVWRSMLEHVVAPLGRAFRPELILVSAGFDAHADDPLAECRVTDGGFAAMAAALRGLAEEVGAPLGGVLEGGYDLRALAASVVATLEVLAVPATPDLPPAPLHPLARAGREAVAAGWPQLTAA